MASGTGTVLTAAHISDLHFIGKRGRRRRIQAVLDHIEARAADIDVLMVTGDIADDGTSDQYAEAAAALRTVSIPTLLLPGNHDRRETFAHGLLGGGADGPLNHAQVVAGALFLMCDSTIPGKDEGHLDTATLEWMDSQITAAGPATPVFVAFHHPPVPLLMPFMDSIRQRGEERLAQVAEEHPNIVGFFCGHAHTGAVTTFAGRPVCVAPGVASTLNLAFEGPGVIDESQPAGYAIHQFAQGRLITHFRVVV